MEAWADERGKFLVRKAKYEKETIEEEHDDVQILVWAAQNIEFLSTQIKRIENEELLIQSLIEAWENRDSTQEVFSVTKEYVAKRCLQFNLRQLARLSESSNIKKLQTLIKEREEIVNFINTPALQRDKIVQDIRKLREDMDTVFNVPHYGCDFDDELRKILSVKPQSIASMQRAKKKEAINSLRGREIFTHFLKKVS